MTVGVHGGRLSMVSDVRGELLSLARLVVDEPDKRRFVLFEIVPVLVDVHDVHRLFEQLIEAVAEQEAFRDDPHGYLDGRDLPLRSCDRIADSLSDAVNGMLDLLTVGVDAP